MVLLCFIDAASQMVIFMLRKKNIKDCNDYFIFSKIIKLCNASHTTGKNIILTNDFFMFLKNIKIFL